MSMFMNRKMSEEKSFAKHAMMFTWWVGPAEVPQVFMSKKSPGLCNRVCEHLYDPRTPSNFKKNVNRR